MCVTAKEIERSALNEDKNKTNAKEDDHSEVVRYGIIISRSELVD